MASSQPKRRGSPRTVASTKLSTEVMDRVEEFADATDTTRSAALATLVSSGLDHAAAMREVINENNALRRRISTAREALG